MHVICQNRKQILNYKQPHHLEITTINMSTFLAIVIYKNSCFNVYFSLITNGFEPF